MNQSRGRITVAVTTYNRPHLIGSAIESVLRQTRPADEIIVVDSGDPEPTRRVVAEYPSVRYLWVEDRGLSSARNTALKIATGDYINFLDDDDWFLPHKLEVQGAVLDSHPDVDVVYCRLHRASPAGNVVGEYLRNHRMPLDMVRALLRENFILAHAPLIRRPCLAAMGGFSEDRASSEEYDGWIRLAVRGARFHFCDEVLAVVRVTPGSMSASRAGMVRKIETGYRNNSELLKAYRDDAGREWWLASPAYRLGRYALEQEDLATARAELHRALAHDPTHRNARLYLTLTSLPAAVRSAILNVRRLKRLTVKALVNCSGLESRWE